MINRGRQPERFLATILFTDIVGSTDFAVKLGDRYWRKLIGAHHAAVRRELRRFGGRELDTAGDGFFCQFDQPAQGVRAADAILNAVAALGLGLRAGVHTGECERVGEKVGGVAVHIAARVMADAATGEVLVSSTVRELVAGSGLDFDDRGTRELKGVPGEWHLFALRRIDPVPIADGDVQKQAIDAVVERRIGNRRLWPFVAALGIVALAAVVGAAALLGAFGGGPPAVFAAPGPNSLVTFNTATGRIVEVRDVPAGAQAVASDGETLWVAALDAGVVVSFAMAGAQGQSTLGRVGRPSDLALGGGYVWVSDAFGQSVALIDTRNGDVTRSVDELHVRHIVYGFDSTWVTNDLTDSVSRLDPQSGAVRVAIDLPAGTYPTGLAVGAGALWVANPGTSTISRIDPGTNSVSAAAIPLRAVPTQMAADDGHVWIVSRSSDSLLRLDTASNSIGLTIDDICDQPAAVIASADSVWVGCAGTAPEVVRVSFEGKEFSRTTLGGVPTAFAAAGDRIYVTVRAP
ncbi:MAG: adenylate/guanylate cyclase domain-containing protein [Candidatus Limnocylindrales bacterium]